MKFYKLFLAVQLPLVLARAPLLMRADNDSVPHNYIITLRPHHTATNARTLLKTAIAKKLAGTKHQGILRTFGSIDGLTALHVDCDPNTLEAIRNHPSVQSVHQDGFVYGQFVIPRIVPRDDLVAGPTWGLGRISHRDPGVIGYDFKQPPQTRLYVLDTGVRITHKEFGGRAVWGANFVDGSPNNDENGHGTHIAATAAGNTVGVDNSTIIVAVKCLDKNSVGTWSGILAAIDWAVGDAQSRSIITRSVINMSIGGPTFPPLDDMVAKANAAGMTIVVAASNYGADASGYSPARSPAVITVAAIDRTDTRPSWSNYGSSVTVFAPGVDISSAWLSSDSAYATLSGTSMASPHVAGLATYLMSREGLAGPVAVRRRMVQLATNGRVIGADGSPNLIAYNGAGGP
ncbi:hypothetical protein JX266_007259 [Neoarthrinium moseri]|uniref:uncharacterized protein n=1 Tax=Neoarthrinium moseri TaxID=1658444 RepID=UPI001FDB6EBB|nr:uncharacterized protein JN550_007881 [Neoarthrinium moseri]KAI1846686.1 hypothetical protein JX266_007259 [Neoarthrinium moseri]KAI1866192.1 hypothetical protein JN550_007881 [Neoarthrinium moseri]